MGNSVLLSMLGSQHELDGAISEAIKVLEGHTYVKHLPYRTGFSRTYLPDQGSGVGRISARPAVPG